MYKITGCQNTENHSLSFRYSPCVQDCEAQIALADSHINAVRVETVLASSHSCTVALPLHVLYTRIIARERLAHILKAAGLWLHSLFDVWSGHENLTQESCILPSKLGLATSHTNYQTQAAAHVFTATVYSVGNRGSWEQKTSVSCNIHSYWISRRRRIIVCKMYAGFEALTAAVVKSSVLWGRALHISWKCNRCFGRKSSIQVQDWRMIQSRNQLEIGVKYGFVSLKIDLFMKIKIPSWTSGRAESCK
jgi:hypothetical protein